MKGIFREGNIREKIRNQLNKMRITDFFIVAKAFEYILLLFLVLVS